MGIMEHCKKKHNKNEKEEDIVELLQYTIQKLEEYSNDLETGKIHPNVSKLDNGEEKNFAMQMIQNEKFYIYKCITPLKLAADTIASHRMIDDAFVPSTETEEISK